MQPSAYPPLQGNEVWPWCLCTFFMTHRYAHRIYTAKPEPGQLYEIRHCVQLSLKLEAERLSKWP